ncbi:MAG: hypothetical protein QM529_00650 [Hydrotalea sp.]|nr:hypothetical protein [Hydrotalea sp.]
MESVLLSFSLWDKVITINGYSLALGVVFLIYTLLWGGYMASWRSAIYGLEREYYPAYFQRFLSNQKILLFLLALPIIQIPWIFILLFALRRAMVNHGKAMATKHNYLFFNLGVILMLLQFLGFGLSVNADGEVEKWLAVFLQFFILGLALWQWLLVHRIQYQLRHAPRNHQGGV